MSIFKPKNHKLKRTPDPQEELGYIMPCLHGNDFLRASLTGTMAI